ncbi:replicative DNA helicase [Mycoplasmopsis iners]|uniref:replicative DNA helicase n=1 Tax=Mycoplasmopsis iners TaxID=76630 RepID=UPI000495570F|nr:replicative DNA helicase [Mycoplasmopsis iners]
MENNTNQNSNSNSNSIYNFELEQEVLSLVINNQVNSHKLIPYLDKKDFYDVANQQLFIILQYLYDNNFSINDATILKAAKDLNMQYVNNPFLNQVYNANALEVNMQLYLEEIVEISKMRSLQMGLTNIINQINSNPKLKTDTIVPEIQELLFGIDRLNNQKMFTESKDVSAEYYNKLLKLRERNGNEINGLATGFPQFDRLNQGLQPTELIILAARPAMGKTAYALNIALNVAKSHFSKFQTNSPKNVAFFSFEMSPEQLMGRIYGIFSEVEGSKLKNAKFLTDNDMARIEKAKVQIDNLNLFIDDSGSTTLRTLVWKCRRLHTLKKLDLIVIDYLQLIATDKGEKFDSRQNEVAKISRTLKLLAKELNIPIIALSQLSREVEKRNDKRPMLSDLKESGAIEQDADIVLFLYRDNYYKKDPKEQDPNSTYDFTETELIVAKNRNGATVDIELLFNMPVGKFIDPSERQINNFSSNTQYEGN